MTGPRDMDPPVTGPRGQVLHVEGVHVALGGWEVLSDVHLDVGTGSPMALTGPSGAGKTVLCLVLAGALLPSRGRVWLEGTPADADPGSRGLVLQTHGLVGVLTAGENVALPLQSRRFPADLVAERVASSLDAVGLSKHAARPVLELSGGERQRVGIARALAGDPAVLVADEPTAELDPENCQRVLALLGAHAARGRTVVIASDDPVVVEGCGRVVALEQGRVVRDDVVVTAS